MVTGHVERVHLGLSFQQYNPIVSDCNVMPFSVFEAEPPSISSVDFYRALVQSIRQLFGEVSS